MEFCPVTPAKTPAQGLPRLLSVARDDTFGEGARKGSLGSFQSLGMTRWGREGAGKKGIVKGENVRAGSFRPAGWGLGPLAPDRQIPQGILASTAWAMAPASAQSTVSSAQVSYSAGTVMKPVSSSTAGQTALRVT